MKKAVMYGAGNIGRGFIGLSFAQAGYSVSFIDINKTFIDALNAQQRYPIDVVSSEGKERVWAEHVSGVDGNDVAAAAQEIATCDIMATAVGVNVLKFIAPVLTRGIRRRWEIGNAQPLNIIICENMIRADAFLRELIERELTDEEKSRFTRDVGLVMASIGRMVPLMTEEQKQENPLLVQVEPYNALPIDRDAFKGAFPAISNLVPSSPFEYVVQKKLFVHNMGHAVCAYLGRHFGYRYVYEAMGDSWIALCVQNAMLESCTALCETYAKAGVTMKSLVAHVHDLTHRFQNKALCDTNERVGADPVRKLSPNDRLVGAALFALGRGVFPAFIGVGIAAGLLALREVQPDVNADAILRIGGSSGELDMFIGFVNRCVCLLEQNSSVHDLFTAAENERAKHLDAH